MPTPRKGSFAAAGRDLRVIEAAGGAILTEEAKKALWHVPQNLPAVERAKLEARVQEDAGAGYERVVELSQQIVEAGLSFADISPADVAPPKAWVDKLGAEQAERKFRMARAAWLPSREAPTGISIATDILKMDAKVKAAKKTTAPATLNVAIQVNVAPREYPEVVEDADA